MIGAGVFSAFAPAAEAAGTGLLIGLGLAAAVAYCNAVASAQLAAQYPTSGGTYVYGRERLGEWWGFLAGWGFVIGKTASCAAMALTFAAYAVPGPGWLERPVAVAAVLALTARQPPRHHAHGRADADPGRGRRSRRWRSWSVRSSAAARADSGTLRSSSRRALRGPAVGGPALLRLRRLRADRDARRGGPRPGAHDPACDPPGSRHHRRRSTRSSPPPRSWLSARTPWPRARRTARQRCRGGRRRLGGAAGRRRGGGRQPGCPARPHRRDRAHGACHGPGRGSARAGWPRCTRATAFRITPR